MFDKVDDCHFEAKVFFKEKTLASKPFVLYNQKNQLVLSEDIEIHLLQLPKMAIAANQNGKGTLDLFV